LSSAWISVDGEAGGSASEGGRDQVSVEDRRDDRPEDE